MTVLFLMSLGAIAFYVISNVTTWLTAFANYKYNAKLLDKLAPTEVYEDRLCEGTHQWLNTVHNVDENGELTYVNVCKNCGFIPKMNLMATKEGLEHIQARQVLLKKERELEDEFLKLEEEGMKKHFSEEIKNGLDYHKIQQIHIAGQSLRERFILFKIRKAQSEETEKRDV